MSGHVNSPDSLMLRGEIQTLGSKLDVLIRLLERMRDRQIETRSHQKRVESALQRIERRTK